MTMMMEGVQDVECGMRDSSLTSDDEPPPPPQLHLHAIVICRSFSFVVVVASEIEFDDLRRRMTDSRKGLHFLKNPFLSVKV